MQTRQLDVITNTKTQDNVTVSVKTAIMYHVDPSNVDTFYFKLHNPHQQITAYVDDCIRSQVNSLVCSTRPEPNSSWTVFGMRTRSQQ
jgi:regulator of protease activity HflC (stomatin/prohibitin superfamily)